MSTPPPHFVKHSLECPIKQGWLLCEREGQPLGQQSPGLQVRGDARKGVRRHRAAAGQKCEKVAQEELLPHQLPVLLGQWLLLLLLRGRR